MHGWSLQRLGRSAGGKGKGVLLLPDDVWVMIRI